MSLSAECGAAWEYSSAALPNLFEVRFNGLPQFVGGDESTHNTASDAKYQGLVDGQVAYRCKSFTVPDTGVITTDIEYMGVKIKIPIAKADMQYEFSTDFRIDRYWAIYRDLVTWRNKIFEPATGRFGMDIFTVGVSKATDTRCSSVEVSTELPHNPARGTKSLKPLKWRFGQVFPYKLAGTAFSYENGNQPITISVNFGFLTMKEYFADELVDDM